MNLLSRASAKVSKDNSVSHVSLVNTQGSSATGTALDAKPLPRLPRGWTRVCHETGLFLRSVGLGIIVTSLSGLFRKGFIEPTKVAIRKKRLTAILTTIIHVLPIGVALLEIILNWRGFYYGDNFTRQAYYQIAAKVHEITIQSSLALIVLSYIRHEVTHGAGIPFGAFLGGIQFLQVSYLWSPELWSSATTAGFQFKKKLSVLALLIVAGVLATTVGPASATLLIPRQVNWSVEPSTFTVNGTFQEIWPEKVDDRIVPEECWVLPIDTKETLCPGALWFQLDEHTSDDEAVTTDPNAQNAELAGDIISDPVLGVGTVIMTQLCTTSPKDQECSTSLQNVVIEGAYNSMQDWRQKGGFPKYAVDIVHTVSANYFQPYTLSSCVSDLITETNMKDNLRFPLISETQSQRDQDRVVIPLPSYTKADLLQASTNQSEFYMRWLNLPPNLFNDKAIGAAVLHPRGPDSHQGVNITTCTLGAGWGSSQAAYSDKYGDIFFSNMEDLPKDWLVQTHSFTQDTLISVPDFGNLSGFAYPQRRVEVLDEWAEAVNPTLVVSEVYNTSAINVMLSQEPPSVDEVAIRRLTATMLAYGLATQGIQLGFYVDVNGTTPCKDCPTFQLHHTAIGYGYTSQDATTRLAIAVMLAYCILALVHILYLGTSGISSTAWDSTAEMMALAINSSPTKYLQNTCAGIIGIKAYQVPVRILAAKVSSAGAGEDHLELVFGESGKDGVHMERLEVNRKYG